jgi:hypothetical protein
MLINNYQWFRVKTRLRNFVGGAIEENLIPSYSTIYEITKNKIGVYATIVAVKRSSVCKLL